MGWYPYDSTTRDVYAVPARVNNRGKDFTGFEPRSQFGMIAKSGSDRMAGATERVKMETDRAAVEERKRWIRGLRSKAKKVAADNTEAVSQLSTTLAEDAPVVVIEDSVVLADEVGSSPVTVADEVEATTVPVGPRSLQITGDIRSQRLKSGDGHQQDEAPDAFW